MAKNYLASFIYGAAEGFADHAGRLSKAKVLEESTLRLEEAKLKLREQYKTAPQVAGKFNAMVDGQERVMFYDKEGNVTDTGYEAAASDSANKPKHFNLTSGDTPMIVEIGPDGKPKIAWKGTPNTRGGGADPGVYWRDAAKGLSDGSMQPERVLTHEVHQAMVDSGMDPSEINSFARKFALNMMKNPEQESSPVLDEIKSRVDALAVETGAQDQGEEEGFFARHFPSLFGSGEEPQPVPGVVNDEGEQAPAPTKPTESPKPEAQEEYRPAIVGGQEGWRVSSQMFSRDGGKSWFRIFISPGGEKLERKVDGPRN